MEKSHLVIFILIGINDSIGLLCELLSCPDTTAVIERFRLRRTAKESSNEKKTLTLQAPIFPVVDLLTDLGRKTAST